MRTPPLNPAQKTTTSSPRRARPRPTSADRFSSEPISTVSQRGGRREDRRGAVRRREDQRRRRRPGRELARRGADVEALDDDPVPLAADDRLVAELGAERLRLLDLAAAEHALVARPRAPARSTRSPGSRRRRSRRGAASLLGGCEGDVDRHPDTLVRWSPSRGTATAIPTARPGSRARSAVARSVTSA